MIEYILAVIVLAVVILLVYSTRTPYNRSSPQSEGQTMLYSHDSRDIVAEVYVPAIRDSAAPFPLSKREERKKTETHQPRR